MILTYHSSHPLSLQNFPKTLPGSPVNQEYLTDTPDLSLGVLVRKTPRKKRSDRRNLKTLLKKKNTPAYAQNRSLVQPSTVKHARQKAANTGCMNLYLGQQQPIPECTGGRTGNVLDRSSVLRRAGWNTQTVALTHNLQSTWLTCGWTAGGKQTTRRRTHMRRWRTCKLHTERIRADMWTWTCSAVKVYLATGHTRSVSLHSLLLTHSHHLEPKR